MKEIFEFYLANTTKVEFTCRINPTIEPMDYLLVEDYGFVAVENVDIDFNGDFTGKVVGRKIHDAIKAPVVSNIYYNSSSDYGFTVANQNDFAVNLAIVSSQGVNISVSINANSQTTITQSTAPELAQSFYEYFTTGSCSDEVYVNFRESISSKFVSNSTIVLGYNALYAPIFSSIDDDYDGQSMSSFYLNIDNSSIYFPAFIHLVSIEDVEATEPLLAYSDSEITFLWHADDSQFLDKSNAPKLYDWIWAYETGTLNANLLAYAEKYDHSVQSLKSVMITKNSNTYYQPNMISINVESDGTGSVVIKNPNAYNVWLYFAYNNIDEWYCCYMKPFETKQIDIGKNSPLYESFLDFYNHELGDDVLCFFENESDTRSGYTMVLEADI